MIKPLYEYLLKKKKFNLMLFLNEEQLNALMQNKKISAHEKVSILLRNKKKAKSLKADINNSKKAKEYTDALIEILEKKNFFLKRRILKFYQQAIKKHKSINIEIQKKELFCNLILHHIYLNKNKKYVAKKGKMNQIIRNFYFSKQTNCIATINDAFIHRSAKTTRFIKESAIIRELFLRFLKEDDSPYNLKMLLLPAQGLLEIPQIKDYIASEHVLSSGLFGYLYELYLDLPAEKKILISYYRGNPCSFMKVIKNNFDGYFLLAEQEEIARIMDTIINNERRKYFLELVVKDKDYLIKIRRLAEYVFSNSIPTALKLLYKYKENPMHEEILNADKDTLTQLREKLTFLNTMGTLSGLNSLDDLKEATLEELKTRPYDIKKLIVNRRLMTPASDKTLGFFKYPIEVLIIFPDGEMEELPVNNKNPRHHLALMNRFPHLRINAQNIFSVATMVNRVMNTIVFGIENNGISMFFPICITSKQKELVISILKNLQNSFLYNEILLYGGIASGEGEIGMYVFNEGKDITIEQALEEIERIPIDNKISSEYALKRNLKRMKK